MGKASSAQQEGPQLAALLDYIRAGATPVAWKFDWLARSVRQLVGDNRNLQRRKIGLEVLT